MIPVTAATIVIMNNKRRALIKGLPAIGLGLAAMPELNAGPPKKAARKNRKIEEICVFSKHLQFLGYDAMAEAAAEIGFDGVDLTVRPGGHVLPENVQRDLPLAVRAVKNAGLTAPMMATGIDDPADPMSEIVLKTASDLGIHHYRMAYFRYDFKKGIRESLDEYKFWVKGLINLNERCNIRGNYQNHDGINVGASIWDIWELFKDHDPTWIGCQYDIRHATVEGGHSWPVDLRLIEPYIHTLVIKDFKWGQADDGSWRVVNTPVGEGMVPFDKYFEMIKVLKIGGPVTIHFEYPMTSRPEQELPEKEARKQVVNAMKKDLRTLKTMLRKAGLLS